MNAIALGGAVAPAEAGPAAADAEAWGQFYRAEHGPLFTCLALYTGDRGLAAELAQEAMARAWREWGRVGAMASPAAWTRRVALNMANSAWRRAAVRARLARTDGPALSGDHAEAVWAAAALREALARLPRRQRAAVVLRYAADLPADEAARVMGCSPATVRALASKGVAALRRDAEFQTDDDDEEDAR